MRHHFRRREDYRFLFGLVATASQLRSFHKCFDNHLFRFSESLNNGRLDLFFRFHFRNAEARSPQTGLNKARQTDLFNDIFVRNRLSLTQQQ